MSGPDLLSRFKKGGRARFKKGGRASCICKPKKYNQERMQSIARKQIRMRAIAVRKEVNERNIKQIEA